MRKFEWNPDISVNHELIDNQHIALFNLMEQFYQSTLRGDERDLIKSTLEELKTYTKSHFEDEEKLMLEIGYPHVDAHKAEHEKLIAEVNRLVDQYYKVKDLKTIDLLVVMFDWIADHIKGSDLEMKPYSTRHFAK